jgi:V-type H+-transporting ATPase subunit a
MGEDSNPAMQSMKGDSAPGFQFDYRDNGGGAKLLATLQAQVHGHVASLKQLEFAGRALSDEHTTALERYYVTVLLHNTSYKRVDFELHAPDSTSSLGSVSSGGSHGGHGGRDLEAGGGIIDAAASARRDVDNNELRFQYIAGSIAEADRGDFQRLLHRTTRGNSLLKLAPLARFSTSPLPELAGRLGFVVLFHGEQLLRKISLTCSVFRAKIYCTEADGPRTSRDALSTRKQLKLAASEAAAVYARNVDSRAMALGAISSELQNWLWVTTREQSMYRAMGWLVSGSSTVVDTISVSDNGSSSGKDEVSVDSEGASFFVSAAGWVSTDSVGIVQSLLEKAHAGLQVPSGSLLTVFDSVPKGQTPPTFFRTNKYTSAFQEFVDTYGTPRYREANPALFTMATFPFLFGVMYGDLGHASCMVIGAVYLVATERWAAEQGTRLDEMVAGLYSARYMLLAMGLCAFYCGGVYNDFFSLTFNAFGSSYDTEVGEVKGGDEGAVDRRYLTTTTAREDAIDYGALYTLHNNGTASSHRSEVTYLEHLDYGNPAAVYPFGVDPAWHIAENDLPFFNSMKMKISVVLGVLQMVGGILLKGMNCTHFRSRIDLYCEFVPQLLFALALFGYMVVLIFTKWSIDWHARMQLGTCNYDAAGVAGGCDLYKRGEGGSYGDYTGEDGAAQKGDVWCYTASGATCNMSSTLAEVCPLNYGGSSGGCQPPNLVTTLIDIALKPGSVEEPLYYMQDKVQTLLLLIALLCVPWMLCVKPYILNQQDLAKKDVSATLSAVGPAYAAVTTEDDFPEQSGTQMHSLRASHPPKEGSLEGERQKGKAASMNPLHASAGMEDDHHMHSSAAVLLEEEEAHDSHGHGEFELGECFIHQAIETIEFVLGMVSNTASYLRLWALSLAHTQLASVFWEKIMIPALATGSPAALFVAFAIFSFFTIAVLLMMDLLECFLHALRLHWIEFQNKFFHADGRKWQPFDWRVPVRYASLAD